MTRIVHRAGWILAGVLGLLVVAALTGVVHSGPLDPPAGAPASTNRTLIFQPAGPCPAGFPIVLSAPGSYVLASNITGCAGADGIEISASNVSLDLNGFSLIGLGGPASTVGVKAVGAIAKISLSNGKMTGWGAQGVDFVGVSASQLTHLIASNNGVNGLVLGDGSTLTDCIVSSNNSSGVLIFGAGSVVSGCDATSNGAIGVYAAGPNNRVIGNHAVANPTGFKAGAANEDIEGNSATNNTVAGFDVAGVSGVILTRNSARNNNGGGANNYVGSGTCAGCDIGPIGTAAAATSPWANISD